MQRDQAVQIGEEIRRQLDRAELPERVLCTRPGRPRGEIFIWNDTLCCYESDITGECVWATFVRRAWGWDFQSAAPVAHQLELAVA
jgi:hypothetical protein